MKSATGPGRDPHRAPVSALRARSCIPAPINFKNVPPFIMCRRPVRLMVTDSPRRSRSRPRIQLHRVCVTISHTERRSATRALPVLYIRSARFNTLNRGSRKRPTRMLRRSYAEKKIASKFFYFLLRNVGVNYC